MRIVRVGTVINPPRIAAPPLACLALIALTLHRLWVASVTPLAQDEAYYWTWSHALAAGYLDHPPMVALWIGAGTWLAGATPLGVRLLGPLSAALGSILLYDAAERLFPGRRAGLIAASLLNATLMLGIGAVIMTPDTPLLFFWTAALWAAARVAAGGSPYWWLAAGLSTGLALTSKYTAAFLPIGFGLFLLFAAPRWLRRPEPWLGGLLAALVFLPVVLWNAGHEWAGFLRQGGRVADWRPERAAGFLAELVAGQIGLATPGVFSLFLAGMVAAIRAALRSRDRGAALLAALWLPGALVFTQHAIGDRVQGNWPAILYPAAAIAAAGLSPVRWRRLIRPSAGLGALIVILVYSHVLTGWPAIPARDPVSRQLSGWDTLAAQVEAARRAAGAGFIAAEPYGLAAQLAWSSPPETRVFGAGPHWNLVALPRVATGEGWGVLVWPERYGDRPDPAAWRDAAILAAVARTQDGVEIERYRLFRVRAASQDGPGAWLPRRR